jgi:hypothetical protein
MRSNLDRIAFSLEGQKLVDFTVARPKLRSTFKFDLAGKLVTTSYDIELEQWMVYEPSGKILTLRGDGRYLHSTSVYRPPNDAHWKPVFRTAR